MSTQDKPIHIAMLLYDNMTSLDFIGPFDVFGIMPNSKIRTVAKQAGPIRIDAGIPLLNAQHSLSEVTEADILFVPGSIDNSHIQKDDEILDWVRRIDRTSRWTTSVCTGSLILAAAGLLKGVRATTHWAVLQTLEPHGAIPTQERVVRDGKYVTGAGVSAGIDMALTLAALEHDEMTAKCVQLAIEYDPQPPFDGGSPATAPKEVVERTFELLVAAMGSR
jgi:transcriptional regulator GlxA family with amidase domain